MIATTTQDAFYSQMPTAEQIDSMLASFAAQDLSAAESAQGRMDNYYNCIDDYSYGGICDRASDQSRHQRARMRSVLQEQALNGAITETFEMSVLCDMDGNVVSERIVNGRFGMCWLIGTGNNVSFLGMAKKQATYNKKGYHVKTRAITVEFYYLCKVGKNGLFTVGRVLSNTIENKFNHAADTQLPTVAYFAMQASEATA